MADGSPLYLYCVVRTYSVNGGSHLTDEGLVELKSDPTRLRIVREAREVPITDGAFKALLYNVRSRPFGSPPRPPPITLEELYPDASSSELEEARERVKSLLASAYKVGDEHIDSGFKNHLELMRKLRESHPGFSDSTYEETINYGCYLAK